MENNHFGSFESAIRSEQTPVGQDRRFLLEENSNLSVYYTPFEYVNKDARIALVGITPGPTQMVNGIVEARKSLVAGEPARTAQKKAKAAAAFSGEPMRSNLIGQLNHWGFHEWLGINDCAELFDTHRHLVHSTSLLRYPVFVDGKDYAGSPNMLKSSVLRRYLLEYFVGEIDELKDAVFLSLGPKVSAVMQQLVLEGKIEQDRVIGGLLHPSGNNTYRLQWLMGNREDEVPYKTNPLPYDAGRRQFQNQFLTHN